MKYSFSTFIRILKTSLNGSVQDYTNGKVSRGIVLLAIPMILEMLMESVFAMVDIIFVSKLGADSVTAVGLTESVMTLVYAVGVGLSMATSAVVSRRIGEKNSRQAGLTAAQSVLLGLIVSIPIMFVGLFFSKDILLLMGASPSVLSAGHTYTSIVLSNNGIIILLFVINSAFRSAGDAVVAMRVLLIANAINIVLDPLLILGLGPIQAMGITGAAVATTIGRGVAVLYQLKLLFFNNKRFETVISDFIPNFKLLLQLLKISAGGVFQYIISTFSWIILVRIISKFGSVAVAGYTIGIRVVLFLMLPAWGLSNAAGTLTGQNLGAGKPERAERTIFIISGLTAIYMFICASVLFFGSEHIMQLFVNETDVIAHGSNALEIISVGLVFFGLGGVSMQALNGAGDTFTPTLLNFIVFWIIEIPLAYFLAIELDMRDKGVYWTIVMMDVLIAVLAFILFRRGKWKLRKV